MIFESPSIRVALDDQIATLWLDCADNRDNSLDAKSLDELERALRALQRVPCLDLLVVRSGKPDSFCTGYDLAEFARIQSQRDRSALAARGQQVAQMLSSLGSGVITVALVEGQCSAGGLEMALACDYRIARNRRNVFFQFPERNLGLLPCWGGTVRLPRLIGLANSLEMMIGCADVSAIEARRMGLIDEVFDELQFSIRVQAFIDRIQDSPRRLACPRHWRNRINDRLPLGRWLACRRVELQLANVDKEELPAAYAIMECVKAGLSLPAEGFAAERRFIGELGETPAFRNAVEQVRLARQPARIYPEPINPVPVAPERIGIVGGGELAASLACWLAVNGRQVILQNDDDAAPSAVATRIDEYLAGQQRARKIDAKQAELVRKNIRRTATWNGIDEAGLIIEAVDEDLGVKRAVFHELEQRVRPRAVLTSTSSAQRIEAIQAEMQRPGRVAGLHFLDFDMHSPIVEIVRAPATDSATLAALDTWLRGWRKTPIIVCDRPGRLVQRIQMAYLSEAVMLVAEGLPPRLIDREMRRFGMARGPLETIDEIGFDRLAQDVLEIQLARGDRFCRNLSLERMRAFGWNGRDSEGFYRYRCGKARENHLARMVMWRDLDEDVISHYVFDPQESLDLGVDRLIMRTVNEAAACLADEPDADPGLVDLALAWGMGWAPSRGGPLRYADEIGLSAVVEQMNDFRERFGNRFEPCVELQQRAEAGESFHESATRPATVAFPAALRMAG
jgi:3-hydroxyacyl-CoA dehydrogenase / enoyl-CoA hydratase / 3-hydroxybutyryl-CoA epimerase